MTKRGLAASTAVLALVLPRAAAAQSTFTQPDAPQWLGDRRYNEGIGIREGDVELHPGIAGEAGYDSNWFLRSSNSGYANSGPATPPIPALTFRVTPSFYVSTLSPQRREGDSAAPEPPSVAFRAGVNATYREFIGLSNSPVASQPVNDISSQRNVSGAADARLDIAPQRPFGASLYANYARTIQPNAADADPNQSFNRDDIGVGGEFNVQPGSGTLDWHFGYQFRDTLFEESDGSPYDNTTNELYTRGRWRFRPRTALIYDASFRFISYANQAQALAVGLVNSAPVRARIGINGLVTDRFSLLGLVGWGASFYDTTLSAQPQYDSVIGQAELKWFLSASPGLAQSSDVGLALSSIAVGYNRDFANSYLGGYYGLDRGYVKFSYFFAGRALVSIEGGAGAVEYPTMLWGDGSVRHSAFTDARVDGTFFGEYRLTDSFGINATVRYTANFSSASVLVAEPAAGAATPATAQEFDMSWNRLEAFLGVRWFM
jgi:hypothetical protein